MIRCKDLNLEYVPGTPVLDGLDLHLEPGSFSFITGPSGAGKSTLLSILSLAQKPTSGTLELFGADVMELSRDELPEMRRKIGTVFQDFVMKSVGRSKTPPIPKTLPMAVCDSMPWSIIAFTPHE